MSVPRCDRADLRRCSTAQWMNCWGGKSSLNHYGQPEARTNGRCSAVPRLIGRPRRLVLDVSRLTTREYHDVLAQSHMQGAIDSRSHLLR